jgi:hypothetical protein
MLFLPYVFTWTARGMAMMTSPLRGAFWKLKQQSRFLFAPISSYYCPNSIWWPSLFCLLQSHTFIITLVQYTHPSPFAEASHRFLHCFRSAGKTSLGCRAGIWTRACRTAGQRATNWAMLHPNCTMMHPNWAMLHSAELCCTLTELCCILTELCCTLLSYAAPCWAMLHATELCCTLLSYAAP